MRFPNIPLEINILFAADCCLTLIIFKRLNIHKSIKVETLMKVVMECIVIALRVEINNRRFAKLSLLRLDYHNIFQKEKLVEEVL